MKNEEFEKEGEEKKEKGGKRETQFLSLSVQKN